MCPSTKLSKNKQSVDYFLESRNTKILPATEHRGIYV